MCRAVRDLTSLGLLWLVTWQKGQQWLWLMTFMLFKTLHYHPSYYQLYFHPAVQWSHFTSASSTTDVCFRHILAAHRQSSSRKGLNAVGYCRSVRPTGAHWTGTHTLLEQEVGPQILKQCPQHWRNSLPLLPLSYSFPYTCMNRRSSQSNFDKIRKLQYFNLYSVVSDKDTGLRFLDNKVFVELLFMSHFANFLLERKKRGGWRDGIEVP